MFDRDDAIAYISDTYKSIHGVRPRHFAFSEMSDEDITSEVERLDAEVQRYNEELDRETAVAEAKFEDLIRMLTECGGIGGSPINRSTALRWMFEEHDSNLGVEGRLIEYGLNYSRKFNAYLKEIMEAVNG